MSGFQTAFEVNKDVLASEFKKRGMTHKEIALHIGANPSYFKNILGHSGHGRISMVIAKSLEREFNLKPEDYSLEKNPYTEDSPRGTTRPPKKEEAFDSNETITEIDYDHVQKMIDSAVDKAIKELKLDYEKLYQSIYSAVYHASKKAWNEPIEKTNKIEAVSTKRVNGKTVS